MRRLRCLIVVLLLAVGAASSWAVSDAAAAKLTFSGTAPFSKAKQKKAFAIAFAFWDKTPCNGRIRVRWGKPKIGTAYSQWRYSTLNPKRHFDCKITFDKNSPALWAWPGFCALTVHEVGHLNGREHSKRRNSIMAPEVRFIPRVCR